MRQFFPVEDLARDERFVQTNMAERMQDARQPRLRDAPASGTRSSAKSRAATARLTPDRPDASDAARSLMHGIMTGEIQALEGAGRTAHDFASGDGTNDTIPFELKLDMARQAWDEARHVEISVKLSAWMGTELGQFAENTVLFQAACSNDPILRLAGVNRALEGLAIDVFQTMRDFGQALADPVLAFAEDWMLADEVTHVKMGSDWLRRITANDPERQKKALEFQRAVDKVFSFGGLRGEDDDNPVHLARNFRRLAGFSEEEIAELVNIAAEAYAEAIANQEAALAAAPE